MSKNKLYITLILLLTLAFSTRAIANLTLGTTSVTSNGALTLTTSSSTLVLPTTNGTNGQVLTTNGSGVTSWSTVGGGGGLTCSSCTTNTIPKVTGAGMLGDSRISDDGTVVALIGDAGNDQFGLSVNSVNNNIVGIANFVSLGELLSSNTRFDIDGIARTITQSAGTEYLAIDGLAHTVIIDSANLTEITASNLIQISENTDAQILVSPSTASITNTAVDSIAFNTPNVTYSGTLNGGKKYVALLTQSGNSAPVATVLENNLGANITWSRVQEGRYRAQADDFVFSASTTGAFLSVSNTGNTPWSVSISNVTTTSIDFYTYSISDGNILEDNALEGGMVEILVYP